MKILPAPAGFEQWRAQARTLVAAGESPEEVTWTSIRQPGLFPEKTCKTNAASCPLVPRRFLKGARCAALHSKEGKWDILYRVLWRLSRGERQILSNPADPDVILLSTLIREVKSDMQRMRSFLRFEWMIWHGRELLVSFYEPRHDILKSMTPFFIERFGGHEWTILTPRKSLYWNKKEIIWGQGVPAKPAEPQDGVIKLWQTYYGAAFDPQRLNIPALKSRIPSRFRAAMPELTTAVAPAFKLK